MYISYLLSTVLQVAAPRFLFTFKLITQLFGYPVFTLINKQSAVQYSNGKRFVELLLV